MAVSALLFLIAASPLMRGGNRHVALIVLEAAALAFLAAMFVRGTRWPLRRSARAYLLTFVFLAPLWLAFVYLLPLPAALWNSLAGRAEYSALLSATGIARPDWLPLSLVPDATAASLLAGIPLMAAFLAGHEASLRQLRLILGVVVGLAFLQVVFGLLQITGSRDALLSFGNTHNGAFGTFANPNHFANYLAMALAGLIWLAWTRLSRIPLAGTSVRAHRNADLRMLALWSAGAVLLLVGILMSRSRGAVLTGLPAALAACVLALTLGTGVRPLRTTALLVAGAAAAGAALVGFDTLMARFDLQRIAGDLPLRTIQASTTLDGAAHFWPWGAGWGTYYFVYPRFQPGNLIGSAHHAHQDYAQMLLEGGIFAVLLVCAFGWLAVTRAITLVRAGLRRRRLRRQEMAAAICGLALLGFLLHSFLEFNMHIPANAILAALLAGVFLRPLDRVEPDDEANDD